MLILLILLLTTVSLTTSLCYSKQTRGIGHHDHHHHHHHHTVCYAKKNKKKDTSSSDSITINSKIVNIDDYYQDSWKLEEIIKILKNGGMGVIPTDSCYSFCCKISSREGIQRLIKSKGSNAKKPLSILCKDISTIARYTSSLSEEQWVYKLFKNTLPGPFTYILPSSKELPKIIIESRSKKHIKQWRRKEIGVRMPNDDIVKYILDSLDEPMIVGSIPLAAEDMLGLIFPKQVDISSDSDYDNSDVFDEEEDDDSMLEYDDDHLYESITFDTIQDSSWLNFIDFFVQNGPRPVQIDTSLSGLGLVETLTTVIDLTSGTPQILRQGMGKIDLLKYQPQT